MPSTATPRNRLEKQGIGENENTWGGFLNERTIELIDEALDGFTFVAGLSGPKTLSSTNYASDESRRRVLHITSGSGGTITLPAVQKHYVVINQATGPAIFTTGSGATALIASGVNSSIACDGTNVFADAGASAGQAVAAAEQATAAAVTASNAANAAIAAVASIEPGNLVHISGAEVITGLKTFSAGIVINGVTLTGLTAVGLTLIQAPNVAAQRSALGLGAAALLARATTAQVRSGTGEAAIPAAELTSAASPVQLADGASIAVDWTAFNTAYVTLAGNRALANPTNVIPGQTRHIFVEASSGTRSLTFGSNYKGILPTIADVSTSRSYLITLVARSASHIATYVGVAL